ncbi:hypothetical protein D3C84_1074680 [compost metagenome]
MAAGIPAKESAHRNAAQPTGTCPRFFAGDVGSEGLRDAVANHPDHKEAANLQEVPAKDITQIHRQGHHKPREKESLVCLLIREPATTLSLRLPQ